jgi:hypothetical protein
MPNNEIQQSWFFDLAEKTIEKGNDWQYREEQTLDDVFKIHSFEQESNPWTSFNLQSKPLFYR